MANDLSFGELINKNAQKGLLYYLSQSIVFYKKNVGFYHHPVFSYLSHNVSKHVTEPSRNTAITRKGFFESSPAWKSNSIFFNENLTILEHSNEPLLKIKDWHQRLVRNHSSSYWQVPYFPSELNKRLSHDFFFSRISCWSPQSKHEIQISGKMNNENIFSHLNQGQASELSHLHLNRVTHWDKVSLKFKWLSRYFSNHFLPFPNSTHTNTDSRVLLPSDAASSLQVKRHYKGWHSLQH